MAVFLHTRIRVSDLDKSIQYYCDHFGFVLKSRSDKSPAGNQICHLELPGNEHTLELTYSDDYELNVPEDLMHFAIGVPDLIAFCDELEKKRTRDLGPAIGERHSPRVARWRLSMIPMGMKLSCWRGKAGVRDDQTVDSNYRTRR